MRNKILVVSLILIILSLSGCTSIENGQGFNLDNELVYEDIVNEIIRFHVIANSDSDEDQSLKLKVRDKVVEFVSSNLKDAKSLDEARQFLIDNKSDIESIAKSVVIENGYSYNVTSTLSRENFPDKVYGDVVFPQGEYEAYRILIGEAEGQNWWCVMFPPLCFVDGTKEVVDSKAIINTLESNKDSNKDSNKESKEESNKDSDKPTENKIKFKFKLFEILFKNKS
ncbi:stage II sporulation protein R [Clostridium nigeriense]|uniref:stage II sporulation protein R n=1 Tax=Clostridium nigeriense TaxID=1805470 RepID=UPI003D33694C